MGGSNHLLLFLCTPTCPGCDKHSNMWLQVCSYGWKRFILTRRLPFLNAIAFVIVLIMNYLSTTGFFNNNTNKTVSDRYHNLFTPAGYAFSIWALIYLALLAFIIFGIAVRNRSPQNNFIPNIGWWFIISCLANSFWIISFSFEWIGLSVLVMAVLLLSLVMIMFATDMEISDPPFQRVAFVWWPFALYAGWVSVALIANVAVWLTKIGWQGGGISQAGWAVTMMAVAGLLSIVITWTRNLREFTAPVIWGLIAIGVANSDVQPAVVMASWIISGIIAISTIVHGATHFRGFGKQF